MKKTEADFRPLRSSPRSEAPPYEIIHGAVTAALDHMDMYYPEFRKSSGPMGDELAAKLHKTIEAALVTAKQESMTGVYYND